MASISNPGRFTVTLDTGHVIPGKGALTVDNDTLRTMWRGIQGRVLAGELLVKFDPEPVEDTELPAPAKGGKA